MYPIDKKPDKFPFRPKDPGLTNAIKQIEEEFAKAMEQGLGFSWGFSSLAVNGQPVRQNVFWQPEEGKPRQISYEAQEEENVREPLVDVFEGEKETKVLVDLPGVEKKDIKLTADAGKLEVRVDSAERRYHKLIPLKHDAGGITSSYKNGVLDIRVKKEEPENVKVE